MASADVDLVLLDLMLPGIDGLEVCRVLRSRGDVPIIIVTARADTADVIGGLEAGADDYVTKPLVASELAARIRALLRRRHQDDGNGHRVLRIGEVEIRPDEDVVRRSGVAVHLTRTEFRLLVELAGAEGRVVTREELLKRVWGYDYFGDTRLLDVHIRRLRRKIERDPDDPECVLTVRGRGYKTGVG
jgi:two-component system response regulator MtrA